MQSTATKPRQLSRPLPAMPREGQETLGVRHSNEGHGRRLTNAFDALEMFPALVESRDRLLAVVSKDNVSTSEIVATVESDVALMVAVLRMANQGRNGRSRVDTVIGAVERLTPQVVDELARRLRTFDFFERSTVWEAAPERFRLHALATQHAADRLASELGFEQRDRLGVVSLLHDIGKLVLIHAYPGYPQQIHQGAQTPEDRIPHRAPRTWHRPRAGGRCARPSLGSAGLACDRDRAPSQRRRRR